MNLIDWLKGKKTYSVSVLAAVAGIVNYYNANNHNLQTLVVYLLFGGGLSALRAAISKLPTTA